MFDLNKLYNLDCMQAMKEIPDGFFELAIVDPPYGGGDMNASSGWLKKNRSRFGGRFDKYEIKRTGGTWSCKYGKHITHWDIAPEPEYFEELFRVSQRQIIWGGNYFGLPANRNFIIWRKLTISEKFTMAMVEYAWTNIDGNAKIFEIAPQDKNRFHPTQKPIALYQWILQNYAKRGNKILDTHAGSASCLVACHRMGFDFLGFEINEEYFEKASARLTDEMAQGVMFR